MTAASENCLFCRMVSGDVPATRLYEDDDLFAIRDINPRAPVHILIIPTKHIPTAVDVSDADAHVLARMFQVAGRLAAQDGLAQRGHRLAFNVGGDAGMTVPHLHMHLLGGRRLGAEG